MKQISISTKTKNKEKLMNLERELFKISEQFESSVELNTTKETQQAQSNNLLRKKDILTSINELKEYTHNNRFILVVRDCGAELYDEMTIISKDCPHHTQFTSLYYKNEHIFRVNVKSRKNEKIYGIIEALDRKEYREFIKVNSSNYDMCKVKIVTSNNTVREVILPVSDSIYLDSLIMCNIKLRDVRKFYYLDFFDIKDCM